jgi:hypothetical protein
MRNLFKTPYRVAGTLFAAGILAMAAPGTVARPGTVNYAEGQVTLDGRDVDAKDLGSVEVSPGHVLQTADGKAEMLLTPGVVIRLSDHSSLRMISPSLTDTRVELLSGEAMVDAAEVQKENHIDVVDHGATAEVRKRGLYKFNANQPFLAVYDGKAQVELEDHKLVEVGKGKELAMGQAVVAKPQKFDTKQTDNLYNWSELRSQYLAEANMSSVQTIVMSNPGWWYGTGWYWNPWFDSWAFVPGAGFPYSPFGFGFYSPAYWYFNPPVYYYARPSEIRRVPLGPGRIAPNAVGPRAVGPAFHGPVGGGMRMPMGGGRR